MSAPPKIFLFVPGILTFPGFSDNWTGRGVTWTHLHTPHRAEKVEYFSGVLTRTMFQAERAHKLARTISFYHKAGFELHGAAHSNGADVFLDALRLFGSDPRCPRLETLNLISPACHADCNKSGLNELFGQNMLGDVTVWVAEKDWALDLAATKTGWLLGFGTLGRNGPKNATRLIHTLSAAVGHGDWFTDERFDLTMRRITSGF